MSFSFDESEFEQAPDSGPQSVDSFVEEMQEPQRDLDALDQEVESRFEIALYYRALLKDTLFNEPSEAAKIVEAEVRAFIRDRLETLLGMKQPAARVKAEPIFSADEMSALKAVAAKLLGKPALMEAKPQPPSVRKAQAPVAAPATAKSNMQMPTLKSRKPTQSAMTSAPQKHKQDVIPMKDDWVDADVGKFVMDNGIKYQLVKNDLGTIYKKQIVQSVIPVNAIPMPRGKDAIEAAMATQAAQQVNMAVSQPLFTK